jgi:GNAT superfamily N-acetyltransferase
MTETGPMLYLVAPRALLRVPPSPKVPPEYTLRTYKFGDELGYAQLLNEIDPKLGRAPFVEASLLRTLPGGLFFVERAADATLVSTAAALHNPLAGPLSFPFGGEVANLVTAPAHRGKGLGSAVLAAAFARLLSSEYRSIRVETSQHRLPALRLFLTFGFVPLLHSEESAERWRTVCANVGLGFTPERWPKSPP